METAAQILPPKGRVHPSQNLGGGACTSTVSRNLPTSSWPQQTGSNILRCGESQTTLYVCSKQAKRRHSCDIQRPSPGGLPSPNRGVRARASSTLYSNVLEGSVCHGTISAACQALETLRGYMALVRWRLSWDVEDLHFQQGLPPPLPVQILHHGPPLGSKIPLGLHLLGEVF